MRRRHHAPLARRRFATLTVAGIAAATIVTISALEGVKEYGRVQFASGYCSHAQDANLLQPRHFGQCVAAITQDPNDR
jgi:hypothetical protein